MAKEAIRLGQTLRVWEDFCLIKRAIVALTTHESGVYDDSVVLENGPMRYSHFFRQALLRAYEENFDQEKFMGGHREVNMLGGPLWLYPIQLWSWTRNSRRVYHIPDELQILFDYTSVNHLKWSDILFPFDSFAVTLDRPIIISEHEKCDTILFSRTTLHGTSGSVKVFIFGLLTDVLDRYPLLGTNIRDSIAASLRNGKWKRLRNILSRDSQRKRPVDFMDIIFVNEADAQDVSIREHARTLTQGVLGHLGYGGNSSKALWEERFTQRRIDAWDEALRAVLGLCIYLSTLPPSQLSGSGWHRVSRAARTDPRAIIDEAQVCEVGNVYQLSSVEREIIEIVRRNSSVGWEYLSTRYRRGHWRRRPGYGHMPDAPRTVRVRPALLRPDLLPSGGIPQGSEVTIL